MKKTGFFQTLLLAAATLAAQTFDADSAKAFFDASPDLAKKSRQYFAEAEAEYAPNAAPSYEKLVVAKYLSALAKYGKSASPELRAELLGNFALLDEFVSILSPDDDAARVFEILEKIRAASPDKFAKYPKLAIATAVVFDTPPPASWPHAQVSEKLLPREPRDPLERFSKIVEMRERGKFLIPTEKLSAEELKYLVPSPASDDDAEWAQKSVSVSLTNIPKLYPSISYDHGRLSRKEFDWNGEDYRLKTIKARGGICTDQAYFTSEVAKARGVPAFIFSGAGSDGFHAWVGYMQKPNSWNFGVGRYEGARFVTGKTLDPQTWKTATDHALESLREGFRNGAKYKASEMHEAFAKHFFGKGEFAKSLACAKAAVASDPRNADAWNTIIDSLEKLGRPNAEICAAYESAMRAFSKYPDTDADFRRRLVKIYRDANNPNAARKLSTLIILKNKSLRPDIAMEFARAELEIDIADGSADKLVSTYKRLLSAFRNDSAVAIDGITIPIVNALLKTDKYRAARDIMKTTRLVLKPSKDSLILPVLNNIDTQLDTIIPKLDKQKSGGGD